MAATKAVTAVSVGAGDAAAMSQEQIELEQMAQAELLRLQRQHRIMEEDCGSYAEEMSLVIARQRRQIATLENERSRLALSAEMVQHTAAKRAASRSGRRLVRKLDQHEELERNLQVERDLLTERRQQVLYLEREIEVLRKGGESESSRMATSSTLHRAERLLGDRLHNASVRFNSVLTENKKLRSELDHLLAERGLFNSLYMRFNERLAQGRKVAAELTDQATQAYDQREEAQVRVQAVKDQARLAAERHTSDMCVLQRQLDSVSKLHNFLGAKGQRRTTEQLEAQEALKQMNQREAMEKLLQSYASSLEQVRTFCGEHDADKLAGLFTKQEEENFALFNYVNELNTELENLEEQVEGMRRALEYQRNLQERRDQQRQSTLAELESRLAALEHHVQEARQHLQEAREDLEELLKGVNVVFAAAYVSSPPILQLKGKHGGPDTAGDGGAGLFLELLQQRAASLLLSATRELSTSDIEDLGSVRSGTTPSRQNRRSLPSSRPTN